MTVLGAAGAATWRDLYRGAAGRLGSDREARWILEEVSGRPWAALWGEDAPADSESARRRLVSMVERRCTGEPLQYVLGRWPFRDLDLLVDRRVLIPRPETEQVTGVALDELDRIVRRRLDGGGRRAAEVVVVDLGTGSGAIGLAIAAERSGARVWATDVSSPALHVARANLEGAGRCAARVRLAEGSWYGALPEPLAGRVDLIVSNPPYVSTAEMDDLEPEVAAWEPRVALEAGATGLEAVEAVLSGAPAWLSPGGAVVLEVAPHQSGAAAERARAAGFGQVEIRPDLAGRDRAVVARDAGGARNASGPRDAP